jgi:signal peptidase I
MNPRTLSFSILFGSLIMMLSCSVSQTPLPMTVAGNAMFPNLVNGDRILIISKAENIYRGEIIIFEFPRNSGHSLIKRVIALPNEKVVIRDGKVFVNDQPLEETYLDQSLNQTNDYFLQIFVPEESYFVLGDNRDNSSDSRVWGTIKKDLITAKYYFTYWHSR